MTVLRQKSFHIYNILGVSQLFCSFACGFKKVKLTHLSVREIINPKKGHFGGFTFNNLDEVIIVLPW